MCPYVSALEVTTVPIQSMSCHSFIHSVIPLIFIKHLLYTLIELTSSKKSRAIGKCQGLSEKDLAGLCLGEVPRERKLQNANWNRDI